MTAVVNICVLASIYIFVGFVFLDLECCVCRVASAFAFI